MAVRSLIFGDGDEIRGQGRLVRTADGDWFDPPLPVHPVGYGPDGPPAPRPSTYAVPVDGADFERVAWRYERDGCIEGNATVYGTWLDHGIRIDRQADEQPDGWPHEWNTPPCPPPAGGWPRVDSYSGNLSFDLGDLQDSGAAVTVAHFRPSHDQAVLVVAATDIAAVEARLRPQLDGALCVVPSRWTKGQLDEAQQHFTAMHDRWRLYSWGPRIDEHAQASMHASLVRVTDEIADWVDSRPGDLITLSPWLMPKAHGHA